MTIDQLLKHYGGKVKAAAAIGYTPQALDVWIREKRIPYKAQLICQYATGGKLKAKNTRG